MEEGFIFWREIKKYMVILGGKSIRNGYIRRKIKRKGLYNQFGRREYFIWGIPTKKKFTKITVVLWQEPNCVFNKLFYSK